MIERENRALRELIQRFEDPRGKVYLLLVDRLRPVSRKELLRLTRYPPGTLNRALGWLGEKELVGKIQGQRRLVFYYAVV